MLSTIAVTLKTSVEKDTATTKRTGTDFRFMCVSTVDLSPSALKNDVRAAVPEQLLCQACVFFEDLSLAVGTFQLMSKWFLGLVILGCLLLVILLASL